MNVVFSKDFDINVTNTVILVTFGTDVGYVKSEMRELFQIDTPDEILKDVDKLKYNKFITFNLIHNNKKIDIIIVGAGNNVMTTRSSIEKLGGYSYDKIGGANNNVLIKSNGEKNLDYMMAFFASGLELKSWKFEKYKSNKSDDKISEIICNTKHDSANSDFYKTLETIHEGVFLTRELVSEPSNVATPEEILGLAKSLKKLGIKVSYLDKEDMKELGMNALLGVAKGSVANPYVIAMEYIGSETADKIALVGKGVTFDSGGISLKPSGKMAEMKGDMAGAAVVIGTMKTLALQKSDVNVVGIVGLVENMPSGHAQKPGDIVKAMDGTFIEVDNTDAEGRLVLADCFCYAQEKFNPKIIIDFATLTGAIQVALGHEFAGLFSNSDELANDLIASSKISGEKLWRLPMSPSYEDDIKSDIADIKNVGAGRGAGSTTAAMFLKHFIKDGVKWAHIDIASTEWDSKNRALSQKGATGFGVRLLEEYILHS